MLWRIFVNEYEDDDKYLKIITHLTHVLVIISFQQLLMIRKVIFNTFFKSL